MRRIALCVMLLSVLIGLSGCWSSSPQPAPAGNKADPAATSQNAAAVPADQPAAAPAADDPFALVQKSAGSGTSSVSDEPLVDLPPIDPRTLPELKPPAVNPVDQDKK